MSLSPKIAADDRYVELAHVLGFAPLLALTGSLQNALAICGLFVMLQCVMLIATRLVCPLLPPRTHVALVLIVGTFATALVVQGMLWWHYALSQALGIYLPLLAINAALYLNTIRSLQADSTRAAVRGALPGVFAMCAAVLAIALLRSTLDESFAALATPSGALITLSLLLATARAWQSRSSDRSIRP